MIKFRCSACGKKIGMEARHAGRRGKCPQCGELFTVPKPKPKPEPTVIESDEIEVMEEPGPSASAGPSLEGLHELEDAASTGPVSLREEPAPSPAASASGPGGGDKRCPHCGAAVNPSAVLCISCGKHLKSGVGAKTIMRGRKAGKAGAGVLGALGGAVAGGVIWGLIGIFTGYELGYVAILVGVFAGVGVTLFTERRGPLLGLAAAGMAVLGIFIGKFMIAYHFTGEYLGEDAVVTYAMMDSLERDRGYPGPLMRKIDAVGSVDDLGEADWDAAYNYAANQAEALTEEQQRDVLIVNAMHDTEWMHEAVLEQMVSDRTFPQDLMQKIDQAGGQLYLLPDPEIDRAMSLVEERWDAMSQPDRRAMAEALSSQSVAAVNAAGGVIFWIVVFAAVGGSFVGFLPLLFLVLALVAAFKIGAGITSE